MQAIPQTMQLLARGEAPGAAIWLMAIGFTVVCIVMMLVILIQKPKGGGLSGAFGGGAGSGDTGNVFGGGHIGNVLTWFTVACFLTFLVLAGTMTLAINSGDEVPEEEDETEQIDTNDDAGVRDNDTSELPPVKPDPEPEPETQTEPETDDASSEETEGEDEGEDKGEDEATEPETPEAEGGDETPAPAE